MYKIIGVGILVTHLQGGGPGCHTGLKSDKVSAIVAYEPGSRSTFPDGEAPAFIKNKLATLNPTTVPVKEIQKLTRIPIIIYYDDNIPD
ncbi:MAG: hypothetical protein LBT47_14405 [Deltaproteobacteria bacterium]|nr:hypothetical protein [Deltaproteobacteria bacterium]